MAISKFRAALDRIRPENPNQDLNLVSTIPIDQLHTLTSIPTAPISSSDISSLQSELQSLRQDNNSLINLLSTSDRVTPATTPTANDSDDDSTSSLINAIIHHPDFIRGVSQLRR